MKIASLSLLLFASLCYSLDVWQEDPVLQPIPKDIPVIEGNGLDLAAPIAAPSIVARINSDPQSTWKAVVYTDVWAGMTMADLVKMCGTVLAKSEEGEVKEDVGTVPEQFDSREQWPKSLHPIRDQKVCGSCWAMSSTEVLSDRFAIQSNNQIQVVLSPEDLVSCDKNNMGCTGGFLPKAWKYLSTAGAVKDTCFPYTAGDAGMPEQCRKKCVDKESFLKYKAQNFYQVGGANAEKTKVVQAIMTEIYNHGPVQGAFQVFSDFPQYKSGIYQQKSKDAVGGHAIKIIGWGSENGVDYWICANSWGTIWGEDGFFRIRRGIDECGIESNIWAGLADVENAPTDQ
eukprot:CAMPEP_0196661746 /NCGR_PEP_ID=MMETSP1086-20130531/45682_1 /TAXON_ID=77921 /ORGANISM="Cyanoptyche  gloeocystis , Strain SAG4.97" /LENGTH=342 /DNA_ID=CAMNT_0041996783 /DNA_START=91 /DNA_END=1119 /DNA_ORIENTATION=-